MEELTTIFLMVVVAACICALVIRGFLFGVEHKCEAGWTWKTVDYVYTCKVEKRP